jgi:hypothetical protein
VSKEHELLFPEVGRHNEADQAPNAMEQTDLVAPDSGPKRGWRHIAGFTVCIGLWLLSIAPLVQPDEGTGIAGGRGRVPRSGHRHIGDRGCDPWRLCEAQKEAILVALALLHCSARRCLEPGGADR